MQEKEKKITVAINKSLLIELDNVLQSQKLIDTTTTCMYYMAMCMKHTLTEEEQQQSITCMPVLFQDILIKVLEKKEVDNG